MSRREIQLRLGVTRGQVDNVIYRKDTLETLHNVGFVGPKSGPRNRPSEPIALNEILPVEVDFEPPPGKVSVYNVRAFQCRYLDDEGFYCGEPTKPTRSYCEHHHALCWVKTRRQQENAPV